MSCFVLTRASFDPEMLSVCTDGLAPFHENLSRHV